MSGIDKTASKISTLSATIFMHGSLPGGQTIFRRLPEKWFELFDGDPVMLPLPEGAPRELPVLILRSKNLSWSCSITSERMAFQWSMNETQEEITAEAFFDKAVEFFADVQKEFSIQISRIAAIGHRHIVCENPGIKLATHFCKDRWLAAPLNRPENFELHSHKKYRIYDELDVNSWVRAKSATVLPTREQVIIVEQDINTLSELVDCNFSIDDISKFFKFAPSELDKIFGLYFPLEATS